MPNKKRNRNNTISGQRIDDDLNVNLSKNAIRRNKRKNKKVDNDTPREFLRILKYKEILENKKKGIYKTIVYFILKHLLLLLL